MSQTIESVSQLLSEEPDNIPAAIRAVNIRNLAESAFSLVVSPNGVQTTNYTAKLNDRGTIVPFNASGAVTYTIPPHSSVPLPVNCLLGLVWVAGAAGQPSFAAGAGVTITPPTATQNAATAASVIWAWQYTQDAWYLLGALQ